MIRTAILCFLLSASFNASADAGSVNPVIQWNRNLLVIVRTPGAQPATIHPTRSFAMMHAAIYDAVNAIEQTYKPYLARISGVPAGAAEPAAAISAAHDVLIALYPKFQPGLDSELRQSLQQLPDGPSKNQGIMVGQLAADQILAFRSNDGSGAQPPPYVFGSLPGDYQSTPPNLATPQFTHWSKVTPFLLQHASQFRPGPPPALATTAYAAAFNEVKSLGRARSTNATTDQAIAGRFWNGPIQNYWNEIAQTAALEKHLTTAQSARLFALLNLTFADGVIAFYEAKYTYNFWRPVTAIRAAGADDNPATASDAEWLPETLKTAADPSYPGAHAVIAAAGATILSSFFGSDRFSFRVTSEVLAGFQRSFWSFSAASQEASGSRIFAGQHFGTDLIAGQQLGRDVARFAFANFLTASGR